MEQLAAFVHWIGVLAYGGPQLAFAFLLPLAGRCRGLQPQHVDRLWRAWAPASGLGLGAIFLGGLLRHHLVFGAFTWSCAGPAQQLYLAKHILFLVLWVSYTVLEVWIAEPLRQIDGEQGIQDQAAYARTRRPVARFVQLNSALLLVVLALSCFATG